MTAIVRQYLDLADEADADLLAMQVGDFYEFFADGARTVADELDLQVSEKSSHGSTYPMAGVPVDDIDPYVAALVERGYRVAVADQVEDGDDIRREVTRVVTPGTRLEGVGDGAQYLATLVADGDGVGLAFADVTTGRFHVTSVADRESAFTELYRFDPAEVVPGPTLRDDGTVRAALRERTDAEVTEADADLFAPGRAANAVREQFGAEAAESVGLDADDPALTAAGAALGYLTETGDGVAASLTRLGVYRPDDHVRLDATTRRNLELTETMAGDGDGSLLSVVDHTETAPGRRLLSEWLGRPSRDRAELARRLDAVAALAERPLAREGLRETLSGTADPERLATRAARGSADARDLRKLVAALDCLDDLRERVADDETLADSPLTDVLTRPDVGALRDLRDLLDEALVDDPPGTTTEGGLFRRGYDDELDELLDEHADLQSWLDGLADREKEQLGVTHLMVDRNKTDGYYIQVGRSETDAVPDRYREIKTLKNARRYETDELAETERELLRVEERRADRETTLFEGLRERVAARTEAIQDAGRALAELDVLTSLAVHAAENGWVRPDLAPEGSGVDIEAGRHPVVEQTTEFVPNDAVLGDDRQMLLVTGPNMSGKSTYMRQTALVVLLAQVGSFVPADAARVGLVDGIYTRVGALDELAQGRSTFMVEMQELSNILHAATDRSLVVLDEVGRGTATYDGISIAWAATEYLHNEVGALTLFATHYHELTGLADRLDRATNVHVAVDDRGDDVTFLRSVREGATDRSYGVHVADLAGVPSPVVSRADEVLARLRDEKAIEARGGGGDPVQTVFDVGSGEFTDGAEADGGELDPETEAVLEELADVDVAETTPVSLLSRVEEWQRRLDDR